MDDWIRNTYRSISFKGVFHSSNRQRVFALTKAKFRSVAFKSFLAQIDYLESSKCDYFRMLDRMYMYNAASDNICS